MFPAQCLPDELPIVPEILSDGCPHCPSSHASASPLEHFQRVASDASHSLVRHECPRQLDHLTGRHIRVEIPGEGPMPNVASARSRVSETRQPQARLDHDRQAHTGKQLAAFDTNLIGLHVLQIQLGHFDDVLMHPLAMQ